MAIRQMAVLAAACLTPLAHGIGTTFTYQGELRQGGTPASGAYDFLFSLYAAPSGGNAVASAICRDNVEVQEGRFTVRLDFGATAMNGSDRYLQIDVRPGGAALDCSQGTYTPLSPRQAVTATPYALQTRGLFVDPAQKVAIGHQTPEATLDVTNFGGVPAIQGASSWIGLLGRHEGSGSFPGVWGETTSMSNSATGVRGYVTSTAPGGGAAGVLGANNGLNANGFGVYGLHAGNGIGVYGKASGPTGTGVRAEGSGVESTALEIRSGGIRVVGAGANTSTPVFAHTATAANSSQCDNTGCFCYTTTINNPLCDNNPNAILFVQVNGSAGGGHPRVTRVYFDGALGRWRISCEFSEWFCHGQKFNVMCVLP